MKFLLVVILFPFVTLSQYSVIQDTVSASNNELTYNYEIDGALVELDSINIDFYSVNSSDTTTLFKGVYIADEDDPSAFELFDFNEDTNRIKLSIGSFEPALFYSVIRIRKLDGTLEEFIFN